MSTFIAVSFSRSQAASASCATLKPGCDWRIASLIVRRAKGLAKSSRRPWYSKTSTPSASRALCRSSPSVKSINWRYSVYAS